MDTRPSDHPFSTEGWYSVHSQLPLKLQLECLISDVRNRAVSIHDTSIVLTEEKFTEVLSDDYRLELVRSIATSSRDILNILAAFQTFESFRQANTDEQLKSTSDELEDTPNEKILADIREGLYEALTGQTIPADEALAKLREKLSTSE